MNLREVSPHDLWLDLSEGKTKHLGCGGMVNLHQDGTKRKFLKCEACGMTAYTTILITFMGCRGEVH